MVKWFYTQQYLRFLTLPHCGHVRAEMNFEDRGDEAATFRVCSALRDTVQNFNDVQICELGKYFATDFRHCWTPLLLRRVATGGNLTAQI